MPPRARKGRSGTVAGIHDVVERVEEGSKSKSPQPAKKKFAKFGSGKSIAKHGQPVTDGEPEEQPRSRSRASPKKAAGTRGRSKARSSRSRSPPATNLRRSPRKKLVEDEPRREDTLDPFPPPKPPMLVTDKPAVFNQYGEKVPAPVDMDQRLRQAINFLSDEGPENCRDFEERLDALEKRLRKDHPNWEGITPGGKHNDTEMLARKVEWMIWVHRNRLEEGSEEWFTAHRFPSSPYKKPVQGTERWQALNKGIFLGAPRFPKLQVLMKRDQAEQKKAKELGQAAEAQGAKKPIAAQPPPLKEWDEPLPRPEVWHRHEAPRFPFGETPNIEAFMSKQISEDLAKGVRMKEKGWNLGLFSFTSDWRKGKPEEWPVKKTTPWKLPEVTAERVGKALTELNIPVPGRGRKRKATHSRATTVPKRSRSDQVRVDHR